VLNLIDQPTKEPKKVSVLDLSERLFDVISQHQFESNGNGNSLPLNASNSPSQVKLLDEVQSFSRHLA
jgi:hypothetical protein